ncbi:BatA domain-containing protein [Xanthomonas phaseoli]|uniref:BatA domain-containing protein n=1 Tax=Xanthomonas phaseoli TaxID=1985254 RepID=UPI00030252D2|nr:BatA domain-containing protein [Xanthomonas phaseoli]
MNLLLLFPAGLAALAALLLPLLIHLARRSEHRPTDFAALRWLRAMPRPRHRVRLDEWPLLLVRVLLLVALALLLAEPAVRDHDDARPRIALSPGVDVAAARQLRHAANAQWLWLAPGFPPVDADANADVPKTPATPAGAAPPVSSLLRELDASLPADAALSVIVPAQWGPLDAQRLQLSHPVRWQVVPGQSPFAAPAAAAPLGLQAIADDNAAPALRYLRAVHAAWALPGSLPVGTPADAQPARWAAGTVVAWLSRSAPPAPVMAWVAAGGQLLLDAQTPVPPSLAATLQPVQQTAAGAPLLDAAALGRGRVLRWAAPLQPRQLPALLDADFPTRLHDALQPLPTPQRALAQTQQPQRDAGSRLTTTPWPLAPWLIGLVLLLFALERWLATAPRRATAA